MIGKPGPLTGKVLGKRYQLGNVLGEGGFGMVYEAVQQDLGRTVADKVLHDYRGDDLHALLRLKLEARAAAGLEHPNIVQVTDFQHHREEPAFLVMDLLRGCSLKSVLKEHGPISQRRAAYITCQVLSALMVAHKAGIIHRDLKPSNIFLVHIAGVKDIVKLLDFGIAKLQRSLLDVELTTTGSAPGTPVYMAPEQILGKEVDGRTDLYSMGVMLYRAVTGKLPFTAPNDSALVLAIMDHEYTPMSRYRQDLDPEFEAVVDRAKARGPAHRVPTAQDMLLALMPWAPVGVRDDCLAGLRSSSAEQEAAFLYHVQDLHQGEPGQAEDAAPYNCATVTLPPEGPSPARQGMTFFDEQTRRKKPPTLEIVELLPDSPPAQEHEGDEAARTREAALPGDAGLALDRAPGQTRWPRWPLLLAAACALLLLGISLVGTEDAPPEVSILHPGGQAPAEDSAPMITEPLPRPAAPPKRREAVVTPPALKQAPKPAIASSPKPRQEKLPRVSREPDAGGQRKDPRGTVMVKVLDGRGKVTRAEVLLNGEKTYKTPRVMILRAGRHVLEVRRPMRCTSTASRERWRPVSRVDVSCKGQGSIKEEVQVVAGKMRTVILRPEVTPEPEADSPGSARYVGEGTASFSMK